MKIHTSRPRSGRARRIWDGLAAMFDSTPDELWYNGNCWGAPKHLGWGTWAFRCGDTETWCGEDDDGVYAQQSTAPYSRVHADPAADRSRTASHGRSGPLACVVA